MTRAAEKCKRIQMAIMVIGLLRVGLADQAFSMPGYLL